MKKTFKKILCSLLVVVMCLTSAPLQGFVGIEWSNFGEWFGREVSAVAEYTEGYYTYAIRDDGVAIIDVNTSISGDVTIPSSLSDYAVTIIGDQAFYECTNLKNIIIPHGVLSIGWEAFIGCTNLESIVIPESVTSIADYAFMTCDNLKDVYYGGSEAQWKKIYFGYDNFGLSRATKHYNYIQNNGKYKVGDIIQFGSYPQSKVTDSATITALNNKAPAWDNWISYGYYSGTGEYGSMQQGDWMRYVDINHEGNKYRGVKFTQYRPSHTYRPSLIDIFQYDNGYSINTVYWFKFEPIDWRVLDPTTGLVMCETIIDSQPYSNTIYQKDSGGAYGYFNDASYTNYASDYETSSIRKWLNNDFYNTSFTDNEKTDINTTTLNNASYNTSIGTTGYEKLDSKSTIDKIFLLSYNEVRNTHFGFNSSCLIYDTARLAQSSDYAKSQGLYVDTGGSYYCYSDWRLRSPGFYSNCCCLVTSGGYSDSYYGVSDAYYGIRPALRLNLNSEIVNPDEPTNPTLPKYHFVIRSTGNFKDSLVVGESIEFTAVVYKNEVYLQDASNYVVSFDNPDILEVKKAGVEESSNGKERFKVKLKAKKVGNTNMTISDPSTGAYITVPMKVTKEIETYRMNDIEHLAKEYQKGRKTHFYDYNGLYVDSYRYWYTVSNTYAIRMDVYNEKAHYGAVVAYDKDGYICDYDIIDANPKLPSSLDDVYLEIGKIYNDAISKIKDSKSYTNETLTVRTPIDIVVPHDGYFEISNNFLDNEIVFLANIIEIAFNTAVTSAAFLFENLDGEPAKKIVDKTIKEILEDLGAEGLKTVFKETLKRVTKKITYDNVNDVIKIFSETMKEVDVNFFGILIDVIKTELKVTILEELFLSIIWGGEQIKKIFQSAGNVNYVLHLYDSFASKKSPSINIYPPITTGDVYQSRGVKVTSETPLDPEYVLHTYIVEEYDERMEDAKPQIEALSSNYKMYDITLYKSGAAVQPNAKIKVMIPIPADYNKNNIQIYWYKEDGTLQSMNAVVQGDYAIFETDHLSYYVLIDHSHSDENHDGICDTCGYDATENCDCRCHNDGFFAKIIWKIINFFNKFLRRNQECECGFYHY